MVFAAPAFAFSRSVRSKVPKGSATDEGTAMLPGSLPRNLHAAFIHRFRKQNANWRGPRIVAGTCYRTTVNNQ